MAIQHCLLIKLYVNPISPLYFLPSALPSFPPPPFLQLKLSPLGLRDVRWCYSVWRELQEEAQKCAQRLREQRRAVLTLPWGIKVWGRSCSWKIFQVWPNAEQEDCSDAGQPWRISCCLPRPTLSHGLRQQGSGTAPRDSHSQGPLAPVKGREDAGMGVCNWRNPDSRSWLSLQAS